MRASFLSALAALAAGAAAVPAESASSLLWNDSLYWCKTYPGDWRWPSQSKWQGLNSSVDGNLQLITPPGAPCYDTYDGYFGEVPTYDEDECAMVQANFNGQQWTTDQPVAGMWTYFTNDTCRPDVMTEECTPGGYGVYVIIAETKNHIKAGINFARVNNLRLVIRNTGHDFIGRSLGWGSLVINTHRFKDIEFNDEWSGPGYTGPVVTIGAGVQGNELLAAANAQSPPRMVVVGECPTVGVAGGLVQGGGHGPMTTLHGFAADNALEFEVVTAFGQYLTANENTNSDLFWALKGGGPGNYAVVVSVTFKTYVDQHSAGIIFNLNATHTTDEDVFWAGITEFHKYSPHFVDNGLYVYFEIGGGLFRIHPFVAIGKTAAELEAIVKPFFDALDEAAIPYDATTKEFDTLYELYIDMFEPEGAGATALTGGWMFTHRDIEENNDGIIEAFKTVISPREDLQNSGFMVGHLWNAGGEYKSATHPKFREAVDFVISILLVPFDATWEEKEDLQDVLTNTMDAALREAGKYGATYVNEADPYQDNWQEHFWGPIYDRLFWLKKKWDPLGVFYSVSLPGTEGWEVLDYGRKLCKKLL